MISRIQLINLTVDIDRWLIEWLITNTWSTISITIQLKYDWNKLKTYLEEKIYDFAEQLYQSCLNSNY